MSRAIADQGRTIRLPVHVVDMLKRLHRAEHAPGAGAGPRRHRRGARVELELPRARIVALKQLHDDPVSLETPVGEGD